MGMAPPGDDRILETHRRAALAATWNGGHFEAWVPGYIWHTPWGYSDSQRERYNDAAWGLGLGPSAIDDKGHTRLLYVMGSADSFSNFQYMVGYAWMAHSLSKEDEDAPRRRLHDVADRSGGPPQLHAAAPGAADGPVSAGAASR